MATSTCHLPFNNRETSTIQHEVKATIRRLLCYFFEMNVDRNVRFCESPHCAIDRIRIVGFHEFGQRMRVTIGVTTLPVVTWKYVYAFHY